MKVKEVAAYKNGELVMVGSVGDIADEYDIDDANLRRMIRRGTAFSSCDDTYLFRYTGKMIEVPAFEIHPEIPRKTRKPSISVAQVEAEGRKSGRSYGYQSAFMEGKRH